MIGWFRVASVDGAIPLKVRLSAPFIVRATGGNLDEKKPRSCPEVLRVEGKVPTSGRRREASCSGGPPSTRPASDGSVGGVRPSGCRL